MSSTGPSTGSPTSANHPNETVIVGPIAEGATRPDSTGDLTDALINTSAWSEADLHAAGIPIRDAKIVSIGGGLGSLALVDTLRISGMSTDDIVVLGDHEVPSATYEYLAANSQIPDHERLRSDAGSVIDNIWGFPSYALREAWAAKSPRRVWQVVTEPVLSEYFTPQAGQVYESVKRETARIGWSQMLRLGYARMIRRRVEGGYFVIHTPEPRGSGPQRVAYRTQYVHIAVGYPGVAFLPDLQAFREKHRDYQRVVNAYEPHDHVYSAAASRPTTVLVRGSGIVASRILQRLIDDIEAGRANTRIVHLFRNYVDGPQGDDPKFKRPGENGFAYQAFNYPKAAWGGQLRNRLEALEGDARGALLDQMGGTNTAPRQDWKDQIARGTRAGFYSQAIGSVVSVEPVEGRDTIVTTIKNRAGDTQTIEADFIVDATGLLAKLEDHRLMADLLEHSGAGKNPKGRLDVGIDFDVRGTDSQQGRIYASGSMTLGGYYAGVDSFLGLQYAALKIADDLAARGLSRRIGSARSVSQWLRWMRNQTP